MFPPGRARPATSRSPTGIRHSRHNYGNNGGLLLYSVCGKRIRYDDHVKLESNQLIRQGWKPLHLTFRPPGFNDDVLALHVALVTQSVSEGVDQNFPFRCYKRSCSQEADPRNCLRLLRARHVRPRRCTTNKRDELPPPHLPSHPGYRLDYIRSPRIGRSAIAASQSGTLAGWTRRMGKRHVWRFLIQARAVADTNSCCRPKRGGDT